MAKSVFANRQRGRQVITLAVGQGVSSATRTTLGNMVFPVIAGVTYHIRIIGGISSQALTTGASIGFVLTGGASGLINGFLTIGISALASSSALTIPITTINTLNTQAGSFLTSTGVSAVNTPHNVESSLIFVCSSSGQFEMQFASEVANSVASLERFTTIIVDQLNL